MGKYSDSNRFDPWALKDLERSGLNLDNFNIEPLTSKDELIERLGYIIFRNVPIIDVGGYWISYPNVPGYYRLKLREKIGSAKYLSPSGKGNHAFMFQEVKEAAQSYNPDKPLYFTEGEKKAAKATLEGFLTIGLSGVWCFKESDNEFLTELDKLNFKNRKCYIGFDSDITQKINVKQAELRLTVELMNRGAQVYAIRFPDEENGEKNGLDDYLTRHGRDKFIDLIKKSEKV